MLFRDSHRARVAAVATLICTALLAFAFGPDRAFASACRTDPIVILSNGAQLQFGANISATYSDVQRVAYTIHGPARSGVLLILYTDNPFGSVERVQYYADSPTNTYTIDTVVSTSSGSVRVTTSGLLVNALRITLASGSASGTSGEHLFMRLGR